MTSNEKWMLGIAAVGGLGLVILISKSSSAAASTGERVSSQTRAPDGSVIYNENQVDLSPSQRTQLLATCRERAAVIGSGPDGFHPGNRVLITIQGAFDRVSSAADTLDSAYMGTARIEGYPVAVEEDTGVVDFWVDVTTQAAGIFM